MPMLQEPWKKYKKFPHLNLPNRQWPSKSVDKAPRWLSSDLRDGNQSLPDPMNGEEKWRFFKKLCELGYKEIEVSFPSASDTDFDFTRNLIESGTVPDDVALQVLSPCREDLIRRTVEAVKGAKNAIIHIYLATSECFRRIVFGYTEEESIELAVRCTKLVRSLTKDDPSTAGTNWQFEFSPETFSDTSVDFAVKICEAVKEAWGPDNQNDKIIFNLPATVELSTPNIFADMVEYFCTHISNRDTICVSLHCHNDRSCAVAATELGLMAGGDRVEGVLGGNGERCGNVDLIVLGMNLYVDGINPNVDFSDMNSVIEVIEACTKIPVHPRTPYTGSLTVSAFSGSHQDAIKKGFQNREAQGLSDQDPWEIPYLPLDPKDIGRTYEAVIRVNSQSGKGGSSWVVLQKLRLDLPRGLQTAFSAEVQRVANALGRELLSTEIINLFEKTYFLNRENPYLTLIDYSITPDRSHSPMPTVGRTQDTKDLNRIFDGVINFEGKEVKLRGRGNGPLSGLATALKEIGIDLDVNVYTEHAIGEGRSVKAASYIECKVGNSDKTVWGVGIHEDVVQSSLIAMLSAASNVVASQRGNVVKPSAVRMAGTNGAPQDIPKQAPKQAQTAPDIISVLEAKANDM